MRTLTSIESRVVALLLTVLVLVLAWVLLVQWWFMTPMRSIDRQITSLRIEQQRDAGIVANREALRAKLEGLANGRVDRGAFLAGDDANAATAGLMQHAVEVVHADKSTGQCAVTQKMPVPAQRDAHAPYRAISASITMHCDMASLAAALYTLAHGEPHVFIDSFNAYRDPQPAPDGTMQPLNVQMTLSGYMRAATGEVKQ